ncbi:hypothetical protein I79_003413 [Cricetulus griseus]|uniref:Uncharacterized protein n=1 Tax=Cricetulus griseus TaxID=10029 RepID=G3GZW5_CRIGR|nr:hypothetical protein I79_003413 [Cricetulus griseus]
MVAHRQTPCWRRSKLYSEIHRCRERHWAWHECLKPQSPPTVTHFIQGHTS